MELVEGPTLADRLRSGAITLDEALKIAVQIADALEAAHDKGIVHRDLKPANLKVREDGTVKVLDFGLATAVQASAREPGEGVNSPTLTIGATEAGMILGTAAYMSPEQAAGKPVDRRADIWSFGVVLWEMLTGKRLFEGESISHTLADVLRAPIDFDKLPRHTPPWISELLKRCLDRDVKNRLRDIGEARFAIARHLADPKDGSEAPGPEGAGTKARASGVLPWAGTLVFALSTLALGYVAYRHTTEALPQTLRFTVPPPERGTFSANGIPAVSPDGRRVAYVATVEGKPGLWVRDLDSLTVRPLVSENVRFPFWSPDSRTIAFFSGGKLKRIAASGGPALTLCDAALGIDGTWNRNDVILFVPNLGSPVLRVAAVGGNPIPVTTIDKGSGESLHLHPWFLPDGRHFLFTAGGPDVEKVAIYVGDLESKERRRLMFGRSQTLYSPPGYILFLRERTLMAQPFDAGKLQTTGDPFPIVEQVDVAAGRQLGQFSASQNGVLAYTSGALSQNVQLTWFDRSGKSMGTVGAPGDMQWPAISPDGKTVAFDRKDGQTGFYDIWLHDLARGTDSRFTFNSKNNQFPVWSPDGHYIAFDSNRTGPSNVYRKATGGTGQDEVVDQDELVKRPTDWSADGHYLFEETNAGTPKTLNDIWVTPMSPGGGDRKPHPYLRTEFAEGLAKLSSNGKWLAYRSDETKRNEIYVMTFPNPGGKWQISTSGGTVPVWSRDGKELFFVSPDNKMMAVDIKGTGGNPEPGVPKALFDVRFGVGNARFDVSKDGKFLIPTPVEQTASAPITVVVNWSAGFKQ